MANIASSELVFDVWSPYRTGLCHCMSDLVTHSIVTDYCPHLVAPRHAPEPSCSTGHDELVEWPRSQHSAIYYIGIMELTG